jgi:hypothetical protein
MKKVKLLLFVLLLIASVFNGKAVKAQCALCSTNVESNTSQGGKEGNGLNQGIMYLLAAPYIAVAAVGYIWYKKYRRKNVSLNMRDEKLNLN